MYAGNFSGGAQMADYGVHRMTRSWVEDEADWNYASEGTPWTEPGGDFVSDAIDEQQDVERSEGPRWISFDVLDAVKVFVAHPDENFGFLLRNEFFSQEMDIASSEYEDAELHPRLTIEYSTSAVDLSQKRIMFTGVDQAITLTTIQQQLRVTNNGSTPMTLVLSRLDGTVVSSGTLQGGALKTLSAGSAGVYLISVYGNNHTIHERVSLFP